MIISLSAVCLKMLKILTIFNVHMDVKNLICDCFVLNRLGLYFKQFAGMLDRRLCYFNPTQHAGQFLNALVLI
jgi:hypothetical protein